MNSDLLSGRDAVKLLALDLKVFENYFKNAGEFSAVERKNGRGRFVFEKNSLLRWLEGYRWRSAELTVDDYALCLDFALAMHFRGYVLSDWGTARQREFGQKITNWVKGQLGEIALKKFLKNEFGVQIELDFSNIQRDCSAGYYRCRGGGTRKPKVGVGIKSSKPKSAYLVLSESEIRIESRRSDIYVYCRPDIPDDHLLRIAKDRIIQVVQGRPHFNGYKDRIPGFDNIPCEIAGWCKRGDLEAEALELLEARYGKV